MHASTRPESAASSFAGTPAGHTLDMVLEGPPLGAGTRCRQSGRFARGVRVRGAGIPRMPNLDCGSGVTGLGASRGLGAPRQLLGWAQWVHRSPHRATCPSPSTVPVRGHVLRMERRAVWPSTPLEDSIGSGVGEWIGAAARLLSIAAAMWEVVTAREDLPAQAWRNCRRKRIWAPWR